MLPPKLDSLTSILINIAYMSILNIKEDGFLSRIASTATLALKAGSNFLGLPKTFRFWLQRYEEFLVCANFATF